MFEFEIDPKGKKILDNMANLDHSRAVEQGINKMWFGLGALVVNRSKTSILEGTKSGRIYNAGKVGKLNRKRRPGYNNRLGYHQASAPGESPADISGALRKGIHSSNNGNQLEFGYSDKTPYGKFLEGGTSKMAARPNIIPEGLNAARDGEKLAQQYIEECLTKWVNH